MTQSPVLATASSSPAAGWLTATTLALTLSLIGAHSNAEDAITPTDHFTIENPAPLTDGQAEQIYRGIAPRMLAGYAQSKFPGTANYQSWKRFNSAPYLSRGHGNRFLNNYGNEISKNYLSLSSGEKMATGSVLAKDSFTVTTDDKIHPGALFLMEKLAENTQPDTDDWRYVMLLPDGSVLGDTLGANPASMTFCHACHQAASDTDFVFLLPQRLRQ